jgi:hypothetical protein
MLYLHFTFTMIGLFLCYSAFALWDVLLGVPYFAGMLFTLGTVVLIFGLLGMFNHIGGNNG